MHVNSHIVLGYPGMKNGVGIGKPILIAGTDTPANDQVALINEAKTQGRFPRGTNFLTLVSILPRGLVAIAAPKSQTGAK
jgi:hypothetical protein